MLYNIDEVENIFDLVAYTVSAMKEVGYKDVDVDDYIEASVKSDNYYTVNLSKERLNNCNRLLNKSKYNSNTDKWFEDTWRDHYYSSLWDDDGRYLTDDEEDEELYDGFSCCNIWDDNNVIDDIDSDEEAYEGFSSCKNHYWDCSEEDDYEDPNIKICDYYDNMKRENDSSYDLVYDPWKDEDETN